jgi:hypothetical protein
MLYINNSTRPKVGRVNLKELQEVREHHMPAAGVRFAAPSELHRVATEVTRQRPELVEETHFVVNEELGRRQKLAQVAMEAVKGGLCHA